jgi:hypothetical protein
MKKNRIKKLKGVAKVKIKSKTTKNGTGGKI